MREFIIKVKYGGLGDHLFYSHLPRIAKESGYDKVYISKCSIFRDKGHYNFIWKTNPFVDGQTSKDAPYPIIDPVIIKADMNLLDAVMISRGLDDNERYHEPELYYKPKIRQDMVDKTIFDPNYISYTGNIDDTKLILFLKSRGDVDFQMSKRHNTFGFRDDIPCITTKDIFDYCDIIYSCKNFLSLNSGGAVVAAALHKPSIVIYGEGQKSMFRHSRLHEYIRI